MTVLGRDPLKDDEEKFIYFTLVNTPMINKSIN